jgi:hypothetical protein
MGMPVFLASVGLLIIVGITGLMIYLARSQPAASLKEYKRIMSKVQPKEPASAGQAAAAVIIPGKPTRRKWQYKYKQVPRFDPKLGRTELVEALVLVYE